MISEANFKESEVEEERYNEFCKLISKFEDNWKPAKVHLSLHEDKNTYILTNEEEILTKCNQDYLSLQILKKVYTEEFYEYDISIWDTYLTRIPNVINTILEGQTYWLGLYQILISGKYVENFPNLSTSLKKWTDIMDEIRVNRHIIYVILSVTMIEAVDSCIEMKKHYKQLEILIRYERENFNMLYLLSDQEMLSLLTNTIDSNQSIIKSILPAYDSYLIDSDEIISGIKTKFGKILTFSNKINKQETKISDILKYSKEFLNSTLKNEFDKLKHTNDLKEIFDHSFQAIMLKLRYSWTQKIESWFEAIEPKTDLLAEIQSEVLEILETYKSREDEISKRKLSKLIVWKLFERDMTNRVLHSASNKESVEWTQYPRYYLNQNQQLIFKIGNLWDEYQFENYEDFEDLRYICEKNLIEFIHTLNKKEKVYINDFSNSHVNDALFYLGKFGYKAEQSKLWKDKNNILNLIKGANCQNLILSIFQNIQEVEKYDAIYDQIHDCLDKNGEENRIKKSGILLINCIPEDFIDIKRNTLDRYRPIDLCKIDPKLHIESYMLLLEIQNQPKLIDFFSILQEKFNLRFRQIEEILENFSMSHKKEMKNESLIASILNYFYINSNETEYSKSKLEIFECLKLIDITVDEYKKIANDFEV